MTQGRNEIIFTVLKEPLPWYHFYPAMFKKVVNFAQTTQPFNRGLCVSNRDIIICYKLTC